MAICAVYGCKSSNDKRLKRNKIELVSNQSKVKFFRFPKDNKYLKIWIQKCKRKDKLVIKNSFVCSRHFKQEHYVRNLQHELLNYSPQNSKKLKPDAIPTENLSIVDVPKADLARRQERQDKRNRKALIKEILESSVARDQPETSRSVSVAIADVNIVNDIKTTTYASKSTSTDSLNQSGLDAKDCELKELKAENLKLQKECHSLKEENKCIEKIFTPIQRAKMRNNGKRITWTLDDISKSIAIYSNGAKAYRFLLKKEYPLPAVSTLRHWAAKINIPFVQYYEDV